MLVKDKRVLATGYNGAPTGLAHCLEKGCLRKELGIPSGQRHEICRGLHAEQNVILQAATYGINIDGADLFCTTYPCSLCAKMLINCRVRRVFYACAYPDDLTASLFEEAGIEARHFPMSQRETHPLRDFSPESKENDHAGR